MSALAILAVVAPLAQASQAPVLEFPEPGLDDPAAYEGYTTRFFRDSERNAVQVYLSARDGRVVHVWADAANESAGFTARDASGRPAKLAWGSPGAQVGSAGPARWVQYALAAESDALEIGWIVLGSMRKERDFQYWGLHLRPFDAEPFRLSELVDLIAALERLPRAERDRHLALLGAADAAELRARLDPRLRVVREDAAWAVRAEGVTLDGRNHLTLELRGDARASAPTLADRTVRVRSLTGEPIRLQATVTTDAPPLTPLPRDQIFNEAFLRFYERARAAGDRAGTPPPAELRRLERQVRSLELLSYEEKLMAGLPNFATYFGRDMMMASLMMEPIWSVAMREHVIAGVLRKLSPSGQVSHEEALGGQAIRENAVEYVRLLRESEERRRRSDAAGAEGALNRARALLGRLQAVRENYHMIDDDFQLPVIAARYLADPAVPAERKRRFLLSGAGGRTRLRGLLENLALVADLARPYADDPRRENLVSFWNRDEQGWVPGSWRDSRAGYANGRFAMDVNTVWVPHALEATEEILRALAGIGLGIAELESAAPRTLDGRLGEFVRRPDALRRARETWSAAARHFEVSLDRAEMRRRLQRKLAWMPADEAAHWRDVLARTRADDRPIRFPALALDPDGQPIPVVHTDPATWLFLEPVTEGVLSARRPAAQALETLDPFVRPYPAGLYVDGLGPLVANDAYASEEVWERFRNDEYHSPRVVWGREVNLLVLALAREIERAYAPAGGVRSPAPEFAAYVRALRDALEKVQTAVEASGLRHNELWSYRIADGVVQPARYGTSSDIQLWNVTDLAVRFLLDRLPPR